MKTIIFICLKIAELIGLCLGIGILIVILYLLGRWDFADMGFVQPTTGDYMIAGGMYILGLVLIVVLGWAIYVVITEAVIPANKKWTNKIYNKYF